MSFIVPVWDNVNRDDDPMLNQSRGAQNRATADREEFPPNAHEGDTATGRLRGRAGYVAVMGLSVLLLGALRRSRARTAKMGKLGMHAQNDMRRVASSDSVDETLRKSKTGNFFFSANPTPMFVIDVESSQLTAVNDAALSRYGYDRTEFLACPLKKLLPGMGAPALPDGKALHCTLRTKDGAEAEVELTARTLKMGGRTLRLLATRDVHSGGMQLRAFVTLGHRLCAARTQREAIQIILDTADRFFGWDACTFDSYSQERDRVHPIVVIDRVGDERRDFEPVVKDCAPTPRMRKIITEGAQLDLRQHPVQMAPDSVPMGDQSRPSASLMCVPVRSAEKVIGLLTIQSYTVNAYTEADLQMLQALTDHGAGALERIQAEERVKKLNAELEQRIADRTAALKETVGELEAFSYSVSHDMRAPLRAMQGFAEKLREEYLGKTLDADGEEYLSRISRAAVRLDSLIQDVLTYTRVLRADVPVHEVHLERLIGDLVEAYPEWQAPKAEIRVKGPLPSIKGNEALLTQCVSNLIGNAVKFIAPGVKPCVTIWAEAVGARTRIWFEDNGVGIASENHGRIFRLFERIYPTSQFKGTGVGLTIVRKAMERMNGQVGFESELGKGSKFWIQL